MLGRGGHEQLRARHREQRPRHPRRTEPHRQRGGDAPSEHAQVRDVRTARRAEDADGGVHPHEQEPGRQGEGERQPVLERGRPLRDRLERHPRAEQERAMKAASNGDQAMSSATSIAARGIGSRAGRAFGLLHASGAARHPPRTMAPA
jgi:hypothetical protein